VTTPARDIGSTESRSRAGAGSAGAGAKPQASETVQATAKFVRVSPRKARLVADLIRDRSVPEARTILSFAERAAAIDVEKVLRSAVANAESNPALHWNGDDLFVSAVFVDEGPTLKRWRARARGRVARIRKRTCHITIHVAQTPVAVATGEEPKPKRRATRKDKENES
jgi:large subunit ribosomal protein L22